MPKWREGLIHFYVCDVCQIQTTVEQEGTATWDEVRMISVNLQEDGWQFKKRGGRIEVLCPDCSPHSGYKLSGPEAFE